MAKQMGISSVILPGGGVQQHLRMWALHKQELSPENCALEEAVNILNLCFLNYEMGTIISALDLVIRLKELLDD